MSRLHGSPGLVRVGIGYPSLVTVIYLFAELVGLGLTDGFGAVTHLEWVMIVGGHLGWGGLAYVCLSGTESTSSWTPMVAVAAGTLGIVLAFAFGLVGPETYLRAAISPAGQFVLYGLAAGWVAAALQRWKAESNRDE